MNLGVPWTMLLLRGVVGIIFGLVAIVWPVSTVIALALLWGIWALADGIGLAVEAFRHGSGGQKALALAMALVAVLAGLYAITRPGATALILTWVLGIWLLVRGVFEGVGAFRPGLAGSARLLLGLGAVLDLVLGVLFVANPGRAALSLTVVLGVLALFWGGVLVAMAFAVRKTPTADDVHPAPDQGDDTHPAPA
ncbi:HdeD family acid-resistance protein [Nocardioides aequoreus]|uniref:HdeD family acid-resistance protein n=1 Tax=Nocardioides aequoreus TaxID=397278 RepID=UPI00069049B4|nr:HdeD family acid-resistance protein [Nocardioides aequoreus]